jgi:D-citramalate synthase
MLPDTLGVMTPEKVFESITDMQARFPQATFDFHPHNDYGLATANSLMAVKAGVRSIHCTVNCLGERAGNASLPEVAVALKDVMGMELSIDEAHIVRLSQMVENFSGKRISDNAPIVGADVFTQTSGIHADGDKKGGLYETRLSPERFARRRSYALGKMSGKASLQKNLEKMDISLSDENMKKVLDRVVELGDSKKSITSEDLPFIIAEVLESRDYDHIKLLNCSVTSGLTLESTCSIKLQINDEVFLSAGIGNGGFDAFMEAIKKVVREQDINIEVPGLLDYEVRIPRGGKTDALTECTITWWDESGTMNTRGVHSNQVFAAMSATIRMLNIRLHRSMREQ